VSEEVSIIAENQELSKTYFLWGYLLYLRQIGKTPIDGVQNYVV